MHAFAEKLTEERNLATLLTAAGGISVVVAFMLRAHPFNLPTAIDGVLTCGLLGFVLAILHGLGYRTALQLIAPIAAIQLIACLRYGITPFGVLGIEALLFGALGVLFIPTSS